MARGPLAAALAVAFTCAFAAAEIPSQVPPQRLAAARAVVAEAEKEAAALATDQDRGALRNLARAQAKVGHVAATQKTLAAVPPNLPSPQHMDFAVYEITAAQAAAGDMAGALATLHPFLDWRALEGVVRAQVARGDVAGAVRTATAAAARDPGAAAPLLMIIAEAQVLAGDPGGAITTVRAIPGGAARSADVGTFVAFAQAQSGDLAGALATAHAIMGFRRVFLNVWLAAYQAKAGDIAGALRTAEEVPASAMHGLYAVAAAQVTNGDMAGARATAQRITEPTMRDRTLAMLTGVLARTDVPAALGLAQSLADGEARDDAVRRVAVTQVQGGDAAAAITTAGSLGDSRARSTALLPVARAQAEGGDAAGAWATATTIPDKGLRGEAEKKVALALARAGAPARLIEVARRESGPYWRVIALAQGAGDIMKHTSELREPGFGALVPAELRPLF